MIQDFKIRTLCKILYNYQFINDIKAEKHADHGYLRNCDLHVFSLYIKNI